MSGFERLDRLSLPRRGGGDAERQDEWQLPARLQDEGNDRSLEAYKITALMSAYGRIR